MYYSNSPGLRLSLIPPWVIHKLNPLISTPSCHHRGIVKVGMFRFSLHFTCGFRTFTTNMGINESFQVARSSDFMNTSMKLWMTPAWSTQSSGQTVEAASSTSSPRTKRSWQSAGANAKVTARPWPIRRWQGPWETTAAPGRSWRCVANSPTSSTQTSYVGSALYRSTCTCPATLHWRRFAPSSSKTQPNRTTAALQSRTGTAGTDTTSCMKIMTWLPASLHTAQPSSELRDSLRDN